MSVFDEFGNLVKVKIYFILGNGFRAKN